MNSYEKAMQKIAQDQNYKPAGYVGPQGPTGPTGPAGPTTITIASTHTVEPLTDANVVNIGDNQNPVLEFSIPRGATGPTGPIGATGLMPTLTVGTVKTCAPGTNAFVNLTQVAGGYIIDFMIPKGETGPTGPTGPTGSVV